MVTGFVMALIAATTSALVIHQPDRAADRVAAGGARPLSTTTTPASTTTTTPANPCPTAAWTDRQRIAQLLMIGVDPSNTADAARLATVTGVGGIFIGGNSTTLITSGTLAGLQGPSGVAPFVAVDEEGGRVQRIDALDGDVESARSLTATADPAEIRATAERRGEELAAYGINVDFAPVLDVSAQRDHEVIGDRSFSDDPVVVSTNGRAFADGLADAGILPVFKHFPGHGHATGDSHQGTSTTPPFDQLAPDLEPFRTLLPARPDAAVLIGHLVVPGLTEDLPASLSPEAVAGLLRTDLGFDGLVFTDDLGAMRAITDRFDQPEAARRALVAGSDVALFSQVRDVDALLDQLTADAASGRLPAATVEGALARVLRAKGYDCLG